MALKPEEFWSLTVAEFNLLVAGYAERQEGDREQLVALAWHIEALHRQRRLPSLQRLLRQAEAKKLEGDEREERRREFESLAKQLGNG